MYTSPAAQSFRVHVISPTLGYSIPTRVIPFVFHLLPYDLRAGRVGTGRTRRGRGWRRRRPLGLPPALSDVRHIMLQGHGRFVAYSGRYMYVEVGERVSVDIWLIRADIWLCGRALWLARGL